MGAEEAVGQRVSNFPAPQLLLLTQGLVQGLGGSHKQVQSLIEFWAESLKEPVFSDDDEVNKRRRELEQRSRLGADQLVQLARICGTVESNKALMEQLGAQLLERTSELTEKGREGLEAQLAVETGLGQFSRCDRLKKAIQKASSPSRSRGRSPDKRRRSPSEKR